MSEFSFQAIGVVLWLCILATITHGKKGCDCRCFVPYYGELNVCTWLDINSPKVDSNRNEINFLMEENMKLMSFKNYFERNISDKILPFILTYSPQSTVQHTPENLSTGVDKTVEGLATEIEKLKKMLKEQRDELEEKIEKVEKNCFRITVSLSERVKEAEIRAVQTENTMLQRINQTGEQTLEIGETFMGMLNKNEKQTLETKEELLEKIKDVEAEATKLKGDFLVQANEQKDQTANVENEFLVKVNDLENRTSKLEDVFQLKATELEIQTSNVKDELLIRLNEMEGNTFKEKSELQTQIEHLENSLTQEVEIQRERWIYIKEILNNTQIKLDLIKPEVQGEINSSAENIKGIIYETHLQKIYENLHDLEFEKYRNMDSRIRDMEERVENLTSTFNDDHIEQHYNRTFDAFKLDISSTVQNLQTKTQEIEKVLGNLPSKEFPSTITDIWSSIKTIRNFMAYIEGQVDAMKKTRIADKEIKTLNKTETSKKVCKASKNKQEPTLDAVFRAFDEEPRNCGDVLPVDYLNTLIFSNSTSSPKSDAAQEKTIDQLLLLVLKKPLDGKEYENVCVAVIISRHWAVTSAHCINDNLAEYRVNQIKRNSISFSYQKVQPFAYPEPEMPFTTYGNDIGLLNSQELFNFDERTKHLSVACLPTPEVKDKLFGSAIFLGWSDLKNSDWFLSLHVYEVCLVPDDECARFYDSSSFDQSMICTEYDESALKSCKDSKGGLLFKKIENKAVLIGIAVNCGSPNKPTIYTEIAYFADWIEYFPQMLDDPD